MDKLLDTVGKEIKPGSYVIQATQNMLNIGVVVKITASSIIIDGKYRTLPQISPSYKNRHYGKQDDNYHFDNIVSITKESYIDIMGKDYVK